MMAIDMPLPADGLRWRNLNAPGLVPPAQAARRRDDRRLIRCAAFISTP